ncbi:MULTISPECIES: hypothetical protein [unclassified Campylobacter]|uniref:hypothetical protein n=1 Tax=unclassified Campylobacter TaxID=2593542 RepID=UPI0022E9BBD0|nr:MULTISPECIES: hypothetical protein [unclassified Campylobacter]MDA3061802.1 hypothetical protein [Campylobacter sp. JMF_14 EL1]MDA3073092.1 hypothetical protein [Campylobacter sp. JMF_10 EL2]
MYKRDFDARIASGNVANFILLRGVDDFQNELYAWRLKQIYGAENFMSLYFGEYEFSVAKSFLEPSLFGESNTLHIKTNSCIKKDEIRRLIEYCKNDENNHLIYELNESEGAASSDFVREFGGNEVRFFRPSSMKEAMGLLVQKCEMVGIFANSAALNRIYQIHNENLNLSAAEIEKFANLGIELNLENVNDMVYGLSEISYEELFDKIFTLSDFRKDFYRLAQNGGYNDMELINQFYRFLHRIFRLHISIKTANNSDFKVIFGYTPPPNIANKLKTYAQSLNENLFRKIFIHLNKLEFALKSEKNLIKDEYLLASLLELQRILSKKN